MGVGIGRGRMSGVGENGGVSGCRWDGLMVLKVLMCILCGW